MRLYIDDGWEKNMSDLLFFALHRGGGDVLFLLSEMSLTLVIVAQVFGLSVCCV